jgi:hypothetical protein
MALLDSEALWLLLKGFRLFPSSDFAFYREVLLPRRGSTVERSLQCEPNLSIRTTRISYLG